MVEQLEKNTTKNRKFVCRNVSYYDEDSLCRYIDANIGPFPDNFEIISIIVRDNYFYLFFKEYIN
jgi:hypothetical protein